MTKPKNEKDLYLKKVDGFIEYLIQLIEGNIKLNHSYFDRSIKKNINFEMFSEALDKYHWAKGNYKENAKILESIEELFINATNDEDFTSACDSCLWWGAGERKISLYTTNIKRLNDIKNVKTNIKNASSILTSDTPDVSEFGSAYWMNAGFTKIYSLCNKDFIIYDGRVGAALGFLVSKYGLLKRFNKLPYELQFPYGNAQGKQYRNPSIPNTIYQFTSLGNNHPKHALWNIRANWLIKETANRINDRNPISGFSGENGMRKIEAALFMIGYDFPKLNENKASDSSEKNTPKMASKPTKKEQAINIVNKNKNKTRAQVIELLVSEAKLTKAGANTYYQNCKTTWA